MGVMKKEFLQIVRDRNMLRMIFIMPIFQLLVLGYAVNTDVKYIYTAIYDNDKSELSREYVSSLSAGDYLLPGHSPYTILDADIGFKENDYTVAMTIPKGFSEKLRTGEPVTVGMLIDGTNANSASIAMGYTNVITSQFNKKVTGLDIPIKLEQRRLYNPEAQSINFMVPGIVALLLTMITMMLTSMAIVREREIGTLEQLVVTPISTPALILGKLIPFAILGFIEMSVALFFGITWFQIPFVGSWGSALRPLFHLLVHIAGNRYVHFDNRRQPTAGDVLRLVFFDISHC